MSWSTSLQKLAVPAVSLLVVFLAYTSQVLFHHIEPHPLEFKQSLRFNFLVIALLICYYRACFTSPGRVPPGWVPSSTNNDDGTIEKDQTLQQRRRWCRRCDAVKPPRAHHCKTCKRCILKMDHHCPWTSNCVSHTTLPHFVRFLFYTVSAMTYLEYFLTVRVHILWNKRHMPSYMGPSAFQIVYLFILVAVNSLVLFGIALLFIRTLWCLGANTTTIEGWEIERHETLVRRARALGGYLDGPDGTKVRIRKQEYPYDIGIYANFAQGMGGHVHKWLWPFAATPTSESGLDFPENGFEESGTSWPPPDPDRLFRWTGNVVNPSNAITKSMDPEDFRRRQEADQLRQKSYSAEGLQRRQRFHLRYSDYETNNRQYHSGELRGDDRTESAYQDETFESESEPEPDPESPYKSGEEGWRNSEGERLADFGVEEVVEFYDEDDVPLAEILRRRRVQQASGTHV